MLLPGDGLWRRLIWRRWKLLLLAVAVFFVLVQVLYMNRLGRLSFTSDSPAADSARHRQQLAANKIMNKWDQPQHSKLMRDLNGNSISLRGTRDKDIMKYFPNANGKFVCFESKQEIDFVKINDDFCDCPEDGSDEPGTNACNNGVFYCEKTAKRYPQKIPSFRVNDAVCDCCDGSDEWMEVSVLDNSDNNNLLKYRSIKCKNEC